MSRRFLNSARLKTANSIMPGGLPLLVALLFTAISADAAPRALLLIVPGLRSEDLSASRLPALETLCREGQAGWMVCRAAAETGLSARRAGDRDSTVSLLLTLNAGARALVPQKMAAPATNADGSSAIGPGSWRALTAALAHLDHTVHPGALGDLALTRGVLTAAISDACLPDETLGALLTLTNSAGKVRIAGPRLACVAMDPAAGFGIRADTDLLLRSYDALPPDASLISITFWDLDRADRYAAQCLPAIQTKQRASALFRLNILIDGLQRRLMRSPSGSVRLILLSPGPAASADPVDRLAPVILWGAPGSSGSLTSGSTRRAGLVVDTDLLPTLADFYGVPPPSGSVGRPMHGTGAVPGHGLTLSSLRRQQARLLAVARLQAVYGGLPTVQLILVVTGMLLTVQKRHAALIAGIATAVVYLPLGMLSLPLIASPEILPAGVLLAATTLAIAAATAQGVRRRWFAPRTPVTAICSALVLLALLDLLTGMRLMRDAWMNASVMEAARYYGIGNEYMGAIIGAACVMMPWLTRAESGHGIWAVGTLYALLLLTISLPSLGAKTGAIPSAGAAFGTALYCRRNGRLRARDGVLLAAVIAAFLVCLVAFDMHHGTDQQSHLARAFGGEGGGTLIAIAQRKLAIEIRLLIRSPWSAAMFAAGASLLWLRRRVAAERDASAVNAGLAAGATACLLFNDAGVLAAALALLMGWAWNVTSAISSISRNDRIPSHSGFIDNGFTGNSA